MKNLIFAFSMAFAATAFALGPRIDPSSVKMSQPIGSTTVTIEYTLQEAPGIVTLDVQTNATANAAADDSGWVSIGGENVQLVDGDVNKYVAELGKHVLTWHAFESWPGHKVPKDRARAVVTAWATNAPPDYLVVDLTQDNHVRYYASTNFLPYGGLTNVYYKRDAIVMRKIPAAGQTWLCGSEEITGGKTAKNTTRRYIQLARDFYIGVFEMTQNQYYRASGSNPSYFKNLEDSDIRPAEYMYYYNLLGSSKSGNRGRASNEMINWPTNSYLYDVAT